MNDQINNQIKLDILGDGIGSIKLIDWMGDDLRAVNAARVSFNRHSKGPEKDKELINYLMEQGHHSPFEHILFTFYVKCPLIVARQWLRHRTWKYNEVSRRYTSQEIQFYFPTKWRGQNVINKQGSSGEFSEEANELFDDELQIALQAAMQVYKNLLAAGVSREMARMALPVNLYTSFYATVDLRNLFGFLKQRLDEHAQWEIRQYAEAILDIIRTIAPWSVEAWKKYEYK
jgi:thymidylate synthase (FAD)